MLRIGERSMSPTVKLLIGLAAALVVGWLSHAAFGRGEAFAARLEAQARTVVQAANVVGVTLQVPRAPIARTAILSGPADRFQREGMGSLPGLDEQLLAVPGIARVEWTNPPPR